MARTEFVTIATFLTPEPAYIARARLDAEGIAAFLENASSVGMLDVLSNAVGGVKLQVEQADVDRAIEILELTEEDDSPSSAGGASSEPWRCVQCGEELERTFDVCWSCGASREGQSDPSFESHAPRFQEADDDFKKTAPSRNNSSSASTSEDDSPPLPLRHDDNPYRSPLAQSSTSDVEDLTEDDEEGVEDETPDELALRAFRSAILGLFFFMCAGLLNVYSMYVLLKIGSPGRLSGPMQVRYVIAFAIDALVAMAWGVILFGQSRL